MLRLKHIVLVPKGRALIICCKINSFMKIWRKICTGVARGLHYLYSGASQSTIHRDAKTTNIHFADFSLSKTGLVLDQTYPSTTDQLCSLSFLGTSEYSLGQQTGRQGMLDQIIDQHTSGREGQSCRA
ncbi:receptor protein kinase HERK [Trifolium repens]|nr:receptor protein kinase HERK [Trifolium repens]